MEESLTERQVEKAADMFGALADMARLRLLILLADGELSVSEIAVAVGEKMTTVSARLKILSVARLVAKERRGKNIIYRIADEHVLHLIRNAIDHACEHG